MSFEQTWFGDWHARILDRIRQRGFQNVTEYITARTGVSLLTLAAELGPDDVAAAQLESMFLDEAIRTRAVPRALRDLLVRELREVLPKGWRLPLDDDSRSEVARALARWKSDLKEHLIEGPTRGACQDLMSAELPIGWLPTGPDDPVITAFVDRCLGRAPS